MNYTEVKKICDEKIKKYPEYLKRYKKEIIIFKRFFKNKRDILQEFEGKKDKIDNRYVIPFLLEYTDSVDLSKEPEYTQVFPGASGGIDIDTDISPSGRDVLFNHLREKYGEERVMQVGAYSRLGLKSSIKDFLRVYKIDFKKSNEFTGALDSGISLEENIEILQESKPHLYKFYQQHKRIIDMATQLDGKVRQVSKHAGGIVILDRPVYELVPVERVHEILLTAFPESGSDQILDEIGVVKFDILGIVTLDIIDETIEKIEEKIYLIKDDDGIIKAVPESYIRGRI